MNNEEFKDLVFDPFVNNEYDFIHGILSHFVKLAESPDNPVKQVLKERTAATWTTLPIINGLFLQFQDLIKIKWMEVLHENTDTSKIDGLLLSKNVTVLVELAGGGIKTSTRKKLESDTKKTYDNAVKISQKTKKKEIKNSTTQQRQFYLRQDICCARVN